MADLDRFIERVSIAYLSMEIAIRPDIPTYSGGLGILAGDAARSAADLGLPMVFVTLASRAGYLRQAIDPVVGQSETADRWDPAAVAEALAAMVAVTIGGREVWIRPWLYVLNSSLGGDVPVLLLDTDVAENDVADRDITGPLYGGEERLRLQQEIVLGIGGERILAALGFEIATFHLNEGHAALLTLALLRRHKLPPYLAAEEFPYDRERVRERCVFTTHTPVAAGQDRFDYALVGELLGPFIEQPVLAQLAGADRLNMTRLALNLSGYVNGVAESHRVTAERMFPGHPIRAVTNGVHPETWVHAAFARLYAGLGGHWLHQPEVLVRADILPADVLRAAHAQARAELVSALRERCGVQIGPERAIVVFARRMTEYKRPLLVLQDPQRLAGIARDLPFQLVFAGKAHPHDTGGKAIIAGIQAAARALEGSVPICFVPGYDFSLSKLLVAGADVWLNTPLPPMEASGTSGMKAALNGVPSLSVLDGWWLEGCIEGVTGWAVGEPGLPAETHAAALLDKLEHAVLPLFHHDPAGWARVMAGAISKCGAVFTSHRMMRRYASEAYLTSASLSRR